MTESAGALFTLEPLMEAVSAGVERRGWERSGTQKTTSHQFEGRWEGESSRSAYLFFHHPRGPEHVSIDVFLDETSRGLTGNLALVVEGLPLPHLGTVAEAIEALGAISARTLPEGHRTPVTLRFRLGDGARPVEEAETEIRFKLVLPKKTIREGREAVTHLTGEAVRAFEALLADPELTRYVPES